MSSYYVKKYTCGSCKEFEYKGEYEKGYCNYYRAYYHADESCNHWEQSDNVEPSGSGGCFFTSACCDHKGLADDCDELTTMRRLRDTYLLKSEIGRELAKMYYRIAPELVEKINARDDKDEVYEGMYKKITGIVGLVKQNMNEEAVAEYIKLILSVQDMADTAV